MMPPLARRLARFRLIALGKPLAVTTATAGSSSPAGPSITHMKRYLPRWSFPALLMDIISRGAVTHRNPGLDIPLMIDPAQTVSRALPLSRRRFRTLRPDLVLILLRKPCSLFLFRTFG